MPSFARLVAINTVLVMLGTAVSPCSTRAQGFATAGVFPGSRVRVTMEGHGPLRHVGVVLASASDSIVLADTIPAKDSRYGPDVYRRSLPVAAIRAIELSDGSATAKWAAGGAVIGGIGLAVVAYLGVSHDVKQSGPQGIWNEITARNLGGMAAIGAAALGAGVGALIGMIAAPERWRFVVGPR